MQHANSKWSLVYTFYMEEFCDSGFDQAKFDPTWIQLVD